MKDQAMSAPEQTIAIMVSGWITKELYIRAKGMTDGQIRGKIQRGDWIRGVHYAVQDRCTWLNVEAIEKWLLEENCQLESDQAITAVLKSAGNSRVRHIQSTSTSPRHRHI